MDSNQKVTKVKKTAKKSRSKASKSNSNSKKKVRKSRTPDINSLSDQLKMVSGPKRIKMKEQKEKQVVVEREKTHFNFRRNKTGTYSIYNDAWKRISKHIRNVYLPFGVESYNGTEILNVTTKILDNYQHNFFVGMREIDERMKALMDKNVPFDLTDLEYKPIVIENHYTDNEGNPDMRYFIRAHLTAGVKIRHKSYFGNYDKKALKGKQCNITFDIGSLWTNQEKYGCTVYITDIQVLN